MVEVARRQRRRYVTLQPTSRCAVRRRWCLGVQANVAPHILVGGDEHETRKTRDHLASFPYEHSTVVIHRDRKLMPETQKDWAVGAPAAPELAFASCLICLFRLLRWVFCCLVCGGPTTAEACVTAGLARHANKHAL